MSKHRKYEIGQFAPDRQDQMYPGVLGWGFDSHGYRIVMYGPAAHDTDYTLQMLSHRKRATTAAEQTEGELKPKGNRREHREKKRKEQRFADDDRRDHGPAHLHVFHLQSGAESKFELIEHYKNGESHARLLINGNHGKPLSEAQITEVEDSLKPHVERFVRLWREMYADSGTSRYVTRVSKVNGRDIEHNFKKMGAGDRREVWLEIRSDKGTTFVPPEKPMQPKRFADRVATSRVNPDGDIWSHL